MVNNNPEEKQTVKKENLTQSKVSDSKERVEGQKPRPLGFQKRRFPYRSNKFDKQKRKEKDDLEVRIVSIRRVAKVKKGGKTLKLSVMVVVGDKKGKIGTAIAKGVDVKSAEEKAISRAKRNMVEIKLKGDTIPHEVMNSYCAAQVFLKPAVPGTGVIAGKAVRDVVELVGIKDMVSKILGSRNTITNVYCTIEALKKLKKERI